MPENMDEKIRPDIDQTDLIPETRQEGGELSDDALAAPAAPAAPLAPTTPTTTTPPANDGDDLTTKTFRFLATATPGTLGSVAVGLASVTYFILGQLGLLLIGAFVGIVLFIQWEQRNPQVERLIKGERSVDIVARLLETKNNRTEGIKADEDDPEELDKALAHRFDDFPPETRQALNELVEAVIRDYVKWWYTPLVPSDKYFPLACRKTLTSFLVTLSSRLRKKRPADAFLDFLTNSSSMVIVFFSELSRAFSEYPSDSRVSAADAVYGYLSAHPDSNLSNLLNLKQQESKFRMVAEDLLSFVDRSTYECDPARVFLREILAGVVLEMTLRNCSKPEWINSWIVYLLESGEPDISQAIDVGMQTGPHADVAFADLDGNVGNIGLTTGNRNSFDQERARRKASMAHRKKLSKADEEMEMAMEEMKKLNQLIADEDARRSKESMSTEPPAHKESPPPAAKQNGAVSAPAVSERLVDALKRNMNDLESRKNSLDRRMSALAEQTQSSDAKETASDGSSARNEAVHTPITPLSSTDSSQNATSQNTTSQNTSSQFTSFDQLVPPAADEPIEEEPRKQPPLTLHNANITVLDEPGEKRIGTRPTWDYLVQIEPATSTYPGWMIVRKYSDFERLHEVLRRIATISGATAFTEQHNALPSWKMHTRTSLRGELERYVKDACSHQSLAESEGMKRFFERDSGPAPNRSGFQAFEKLGKNVFDVLTNAPLEGSKAVVGGVTGVLGNIGFGQKKPAATTPAASAPAPASTSSTPPPQTPLQDVTAASRLSMSTLPRPDSSLSLSGMRKARDSIDSQRSSVISTQPGRLPRMDRRPSYQSQGEPEADSLRPSWRGASARNSREHSRASSVAPLRSPSTLSLSDLRLPPPPDAITDDYESPISPANNSNSVGNNNTSASSRQDFQSHSRSMTMPALSGTRSPRPPKAAQNHSTLSEQEARVAVELLFAVINELYTLSSAWNIRRTLLAAAKSFLLRPGNPSLTSIQSLIQASVLDANTSDSGLAAHLKKLRENALPTEEERASWPAAEMSAEEKDKLRIKARKLLIESGVPAALMGVMGQTATSDALGRLFDCLQIEEVARGLMFGILLQGVRVVTH